MLDQPSETEMIESSGNRVKSIAQERGGDNRLVEANRGANLSVRAALMLDLRSYIESRGWTQLEAAEFFGETQPRISNLMNGEISRFSVDKLILMLSQAGKEVQIKVVPKIS
jgi:predicted XRE-type DNA-binding protein